MDKKPKNVAACYTPCKLFLDIDVHGTAEDSGHAKLVAERVFLWPGVPQVGQTFVFDINYDADSTVLRTAVLGQEADRLSVNLSPTGVTLRGKLTRKKLLAYIESLQEDGWVFLFPVEYWENGRGQRFRAPQLAELPPDVNPEHN